MTDESILYIFKFPKVCILIVAFIGNFLSKVFLFVKIAIQSTNLSQKTAIKRIFRILLKYFQKMIDEMSVSSV